MFNRSFTLVAALLLATGCEPVASPSRVVSGPPAPPSPVADTGPDATAPLAEQAQPAAVTIPAGSRLPLAQGELPTAAAPPAARHSIRLSAGVALPQLLPEGTQIGVSVDYSVAGELSTSANHFLVVSSQVGELSLPVKLSREGGTLQTFCPPDLRPEHKPFSARIEEQISGGKRTAVSNTEQLATSY